MGVGYLKGGLKMGAIRKNGKIRGGRIHAIKWLHWRVVCIGGEGEVWGASMDAMRFIHASSVAKKPF